MQTIVTIVTVSGGKDKPSVIVCLCNISPMVAASETDVTVNRILLSRFKLLIVNALAYVVTV